jgi:DNA polymerase-3 subunit alpha
MKNIDNYANVKHEIEEAAYPHPLIQPILEDTYGVIIYQEQVMQIAQTLSGYSLGEADLLRRAMGKKLPAEMKKQKSRFLEGAKKNKVDPEIRTPPPTSSTWWRSSPATASTSPTPPPMPSSPTRRPI